MENDTTAPAEVEQPAQEVQQEAPAQEQQPTTEEVQAEARRRLRILASEIDLPETIDEETYKRLEEIGGQINRGVDAKFKEAAAARRQAEQEREQVQQWRAEQMSLVQKNQEVAALRWQTKDYENTDWFAEISRAPDEETKQRVRDLKDWVESTNRKAEKLEAEVRQTTSLEQQQGNALVQHFLQAGDQVLRHQIKDWGPQKQQLVAKTMQEYGIGQTHPDLDRFAWMAATHHPAIIRAFHDAAMYRKSIEKATADSRPETPTPRPVSKVGGNASHAKDPDKMSTEEWLRWRNAQLKGKAA